MQRHAEIAGAGFAGLTAGAALAQRGWSVRVHERAAEAREFGAGIWTWENGLRVLNEIGAADEAFEGILVVPSWESRDKNGRIIDYFPMGTHETGGRLFCITRQQLHGAVLNAALRSGVELVTSSEAMGATPEGELLIKGGERFKADLVIGADGIHSAVRESLGLLKRRRKHACGSIRVLIPRHEEEWGDAELDTIFELWRGPRRLLFTPCSKDVIYLHLCSLVRDREALTIPVNLDLWSRDFPQHEKFIRRIPEGGRWDQFETLWLTRWSEGKVAIIGDAAHGMLPGLGQGCGTAMMNALSLAVSLDEDGDVARALSVWEQRERPLTEHTQIYSKTLWPASYLGSGLARVCYNFPVFKPWLAKQRAKPSLHTPHGTAGQERWVPVALRGAGAAAAS